MNNAAAKEQLHNGLKEVSSKVVQMLKARWTANKKRHHSEKSGCVLLSKAEHRLVFTPNATVSHVWWQHFLAGNDNTEYIINT